ncbi:MAG: 5'/3'-nucleotidase SurE [Candidatus Sumerlaeaceae bacterium]|nr:5'/3'-nucleotidase SurE [Candidatus Sumerlaeaceae bacterium]
MRVLISNDDGVEAPGIWALFQEISTIADTIVVAPVSERSAIGHGISVFNEITLRQHIREDVQWAYAIDGTPADCVKMALTVIMKDAQPDLVISGINRGQNTGTSIIYSGTVAAALEATMAGLPAMAISLAAFTPQIADHAKIHDPQSAIASLADLARDPADYAPAARYASKLAYFIERRGLPKGVLLNVNVPHCPEDQIRGTVVSKMGHSVFIDEYEAVGEKAGVIAYKNIGKELINSPHGDDWDDLVLKENKVSITPLHYDMTHHHFLGELKKWWADEEREARDLASGVANGLSKELDAEVKG